MGLTGTELGAEIGNIYKMGKEVLPGVADDYNDAWANTPAAVSGSTSRGGGLGDDPGPKMDALLDKLNKATFDTEDALRDVAQALVWTADDYVFTDQAAKDEFDRKRKKVDE